MRSAPLSGQGNLCLGVFVDACYSTPFPGTGQWSSQQQAAARGLSTGGSQRVVASPSAQQRPSSGLGSSRSAGVGMNAYGFDDDDVLTGTVRAGATQVGLQGVLVS